MPSLIHTTLQPNHFSVLADSGTVQDSEALFCTRKRRILYRGTEEKLITTFKQGAGGSPSGGANMLCAGVQGAELCEGTAKDPHWEAEVQWVGIHSALAPADSKDFIYRLIFNLGRSEQNLPIKVPKEGGAEGDEIVVAAVPPFINLPVYNAAHGYKRVRLINFVPMVQVIGVIKDTGTFPISIVTGKIKTLITMINTVYGSAAALGAMIQDWSKLPDPLYTYCAGFLTAQEQFAQAGKFVPVSISSHRHLNYGSLFAFTMDLTWEQGITP